MDDRYELVITAEAEVIPGEPEPQEEVDEE